MDGKRLLLPAPQPRQPLCWLAGLLPTSSALGLVISGAVLATPMVGQQIAVQWNFNDTNSYAASAGTGMYSLLGGVSAEFFGGSQTDPVPPASNFALSLTSFPAQATAPNTAGVGFSCDARWWRDLRLTFDFRGSPSASGTIAVLCSTNGTDFFDAGSFSITTADVFLTGLTLDLAPYHELNHTPGLEIRLVSDFGPGTGSYRPIQAGASYSPAGRWRLDMVTLSGTPEPPRIVVQPQGRILSVPEPVTLSVVAEGILPLAYQWKHCGTNLPGATQAELLISNPSATDLGQYQVFVSNIGGECESEVVFLTASKPLILNQPQGQIIDGTKPVILQVAATGIGPLAYQWFHCSTNLPGQNGPTLSIMEPTSSDLGPYYVEVTNAGGTITSVEAMLNAAAPLIISGPKSCAPTEGAFLKLECVSTGLLPLQYQWFHHGSSLTGATQSVLVFTNVSLADAGDYFVVVSNAGGSVTSAVASVAVRAAPAKVGISQLRETLDPQTLDVTDTNSLFTVEGVVVSHCNLTQKPDMLFFIQDQTSGVAVWWDNGADVFELDAGDLVRVVGRLMNIDGLLVLNASVGDATTAVVRLDTTQPLPSAVVLDLGALPSPAGLDTLEGSLVVISNVVMDTGLKTFPTTTREFVIADFDGDVFMLGAHELTDVAEKPLPEKPFTVTGILFQHDTQSPYTSSFCVLPTRYSDIVQNDAFPLFDQPMVDRREAPNGTPRQLSTSPDTAFSWEWRMVLKPVESVAEINQPASRTPTFTTDVPGLYALYLRTRYGSGSNGVGIVEVRSLTNQPPIITGPTHVTVSESDFYMPCHSIEKILCHISASDPDPLPNQFFPLVWDVFPLVWDVQSPIIGYAMVSGDTCTLYASAGPLIPRCEIEYEDWLAVGLMEDYGGATYQAVFSVTDNGLPPQTSTHVVEITVLEDNVPPHAPSTTWHFVEGVENQATLEALDLDTPAQTLTYHFPWGYDQMLTGPVYFDSSTGTLRWTPSEGCNQEFPGGLGSMPYFVSDPLGGQAMGNVCIIVREVNSPPQIEPIDDLRIVERQTVLQKLEVCDPDLPTNRVTISLKTAPPGMQLDPTTHVLSWTPGEVDGGTTNRVIVEAVDDGVPPLSTSISFFVVVEKVNEPPRFQNVSNQSINEGEALTLKLTASDDDLPPNELRFLLTQGPSGMTLDASTGVLSWTPAEDQGPATFTVSVTVSDDGVPPLADSTSFQVTVNEVNAPPVLSAIADRAVDVGQTVSVVCTALDPDIPVNTLTWQLIEGAAGATINESTGELTWTLEQSHAGQTFRFTVRVTDNGTPSLSDQKSFQVSVNPIPAPDPTGIQWALVPGPYAGRLWGVEYGAGLFVAVGANGTVLTSPDGLAWTQRTTPTTETLWGLKYGCGRFVVAGHNGVILTSTNGIDWEASPSGVTAHLTDVAFAGETCVVVGNFNTILASLRGEGPWTVQPVNTTNHFQDVTYGGGYFVASGTVGLIATSPDGLTWTVRDSGTTNGVPMTAYGNGVWVVGGERGILLKSTNLVEWQQVPSGVDCLLAGASHANGRFVVVGGVKSGMSGGVVLVSTNGIDWLREEAEAFPMLQDVAYGAGIWVAVGENGGILRSVQLFPPWALDIAVSGGGTVLRSPDSPLYDDGQTVTLTAVPNADWQFMGWSGDASGSDNPLAVLMNTNKTVRAMFSPSGPTYELVVETWGSGHVDVTPLKQSYQAGETVHLKAVPAEGWTFCGWLRGVDQVEAAEIDLTMNLDKTVAASFGAPPLFSPPEFSGECTVDEQGNCVASENAPLRIRLTAEKQGKTPYDEPANAVRIALLPGAPANMVLAESGDLGDGRWFADVVWVPTEEQGPGIYKVSAEATACGGNSIQSFTIVVSEINTAPVLANVGFYGVGEGRPLNLYFRATDSDIPKQNLTFALENAPRGATANPTTGFFSWTPAEEQGPGEYAMTVVVTDDGNPALSDKKTLRVTVTEVNSPPVVASLADKTVNEGELLLFTAQATDPDVPVNRLTFSLAPGAPEGATIDSKTGAFYWRPSEAQGPGTYAITVRVSDDGSPVLSSTATFNTTVLEVNEKPVLSPVGTQYVEVGETLTVHLAANDNDLPPNSLSYSFAMAEPSGATLDALTGVLTWTPTSAFASTTNRFTVRVTDDGVPELSDTISFNAVVGPNRSIRITALGSQNGQFVLQVACEPGRTLFVEASADLVHWSLLTTIAGTGAPVEIEDLIVPGQQCRFYRVVAP
ncbi:MAG: putative Ig domain-containing protein [Verrucomicrobiota bacterium]|nr:putative Ig domain-containing protein [Verrucomicrobiota bacterium]